MTSLRNAVRSLRREPALVAGVVATFALAIGANAAMFGLVSRLMLAAPPGVADPGQVGRVVMSTNYPEYRRVAALDDAFSGVAAVRDMNVIVGRGGDASEARAIAATGGYFQVLGARPALGRFFDARDDELPAGNAVVVLSHAFFNKRFGGDRAALGREIEIDGVRFTVIGVSGPNFSGDQTRAVDVFLPLSAAMRAQEQGWWSNDQIRMVSIIARARDGVTTEAAGGRAGIELESLLPSSVRNSTQARIAKWLMGVSLIVLVIATANVGTLLLLRALRKRREVAVRMALGASRVRLIGQLTLESTLLALAGGAAGLLLSGWLADVVRATLMPDLAPTDGIADPRLLALTLALSVGAGVIAGLTPLALVAQKSLTADLTGSGTLGSHHRARAQRGLVGLQVALCTVLLVGAGLFVRSLDRVRSQELGYSVAKLLWIDVDFRERLGGAREDDYHREVARKIGEMAGVTGASIAQATPFGSFHVPPISVPGRNDPPNVNGQLPMLYASTPEYLRLMNVRLLQGRLLDESDRAGSQLVALVNETFAREVWPGETALGKCIRAGHDPFSEPMDGMASPALPCRTVVGVVRDSRVRSLRPVNREASLMQYYVPFEQAPRPPAFVGDIPSVSGLVVGVSGEPAEMAPAVQRLIQSTSTVPVYARVRPYQELLDPQMRPWRLGATLFVAFGALALAIAAVGLFGVVSYIVSQRTREIGLRLALGGTSGVVGRAVLAQTLRMVAVGVVAGLLVALAVGPRVRDLLFQTTPRDLPVLIAAALSLLAVAIVAALLPAWRASRVSPMVALRTD
jgi:putative ABC transport system permease protein